MDLVEIKVTGFKRFREGAVLKTNGKLVAIVGPNEAGKTSLLRAISLAHNDDAIPATEISRGVEPSKARIVARYLLNEMDRQESGLQDQRWFVVTKKPDGTKVFEILPNPPQRDLSTRGALHLAISTAAAVPHIRKQLSAEIESELINVGNVLSSSDETLDAESIDLVLNLTRAIEPLVKPKDLAQVRKIGSSAAEWAEQERKENPRDFAYRKLKERIPGALVFGEKERDLRSEYNIQELSASVPIALENLFDIAEIKVKDLIELYLSDDSAGLTTMEHAANAILAAKFSENWQQSGVHVSLRVQGDQLLIQVVNGRIEFTSFAERSDGLRQFVALQSFAMANWSNQPILLIDEAEQKLHYDAQADLVQMLARQNVASKVIYSTHSAGCLPEDLGNGVRFAKPSGRDSTSSMVVNKFWADNEPGFAPLLMGMGASTLAFFPTRNAVMVEGPSDMLLMPSLIREALELEVLGFQIVPGLAEMSKSAPSPVLTRDSGVLHLIDGDGGGESIRKHLLECNVQTEDIFTLKSIDGSAVELEDFIDPILLTEAVNSLLAKYHGVAPLLGVKDLKSKHRMKSLIAWFEARTSQPLPKVELAYEILDMKYEDPERCLLDKKRKGRLAEICGAILRRFEELKKQ